MFWKIFIATLALVFALFFTTKASATEPVSKEVVCELKAVGKGVGWSAVYGGAILGIGSAIGVAVAPASIPTIAAVSIIAGETLVGAMIGAGSSFVTRISDLAHFNENLVREACKEKEMSFIDRAKKSLGKAVEGTKESVGKAVEVTKDSVGKAVEVTKDSVGNVAQKMKEYFNK